MSTDEWCLGLCEIEEQSPGSRGFHRYQKIYVMRDGKPAEFRKDMGTIKKWVGIPPFNIPGGAVDKQGHIYIEEKVGNLIEIANQIRGQRLDMRDRIGIDNIRLK